MPTGVMMQSVCVNNPDLDITFHIITGGVTAQDKKDLQDIVAPFQGKSITFYDVNVEDFRNMPALHTRPGITAATYYRLFLTEILPTSIDKVLYLDGDIIVRHSLEDLWDTDIEGYALAAVPDSIQFEEKTYAKLTFSKQEGYFNAGMMLVNLKYWREHHAFQSFLHFIKNEANRIFFHDQDVLNCIFHDKKKNLPIRYNLISSHLGQTQESSVLKNGNTCDKDWKDPVILHFTTRKPWKKASRHPYRSSFFKYQAQTKWHDMPLQEDRPLTLRMKKAVSGVLRKHHIMSPAPPYQKYFIKGLKPID
jgi:lipopolysaccharide biosynthesis glycosyltransferase